MGTSIRGWLLKPGREWNRTDYSSPFFSGIPNPKSEFCVNIKFRSISLHFGFLLTANPQSYFFAVTIILRVKISLLTSTSNLF